MDAGHVVHSNAAASRAGGAVSGFSWTVTGRGVFGGHFTATCSACAGRPIRWPTANGGPPAGCQDQYFEGPIEAIGCLTMLADYGQIPAPDYKLLCPSFAAGCSGSAGLRPWLLPVASAQTVRVYGVDVTPASGRDPAPISRSRRS